MIEIEEIVPYYICDKNRDCNVSPSCGDEFCQHTALELYAKNKDSIDIVNALRDRFTCYVLDGKLLLSEKER